MENIKEAIYWMTQGETPEVAYGYIYEKDGKYGYHDPSEHKSFNTVEKLEAYLIKNYA